MKRFLVFLIPFLLTAFFYIFHYKYNVSASIYIEKGISIKDISKKLAEKKIILSEKLFLIYALIRNKPLKSGYYSFKGKYSISDVWYKIYQGKEDLIKVTITAGNDLFEIAEKLNESRIIDKEIFLKLAFDKEFLKKLGLSYSSFEGFIYPDTYFLPKNIPSEKLFNFLLDKFKKQYNIQDIKENFYKKMIIASLIEKETANFKEKRIIAGIIYKRLKINMPLQIDATVIYAKKLLKKWNGKLSKEDYKIESPFNTYINYRLPPTPISSFSKESLYAVENPENTEYLYYFTKDGKRHIFSKTYKEHLKKLKGGR